MNDLSPAVSTDRTWDPTALLRLGILALPLGNALKLVGNLGTFDSIGYGVPPAQEAATAAGAGFFVGEFVGSILPVLFGIFGVFALFGYLVGRAGRRTLLAALICSVLGAGLTLAALGVINYAVPALAHRYQAGDTGAMRVVDAFFSWPWGAVLYPAVLFPIGLLLFCLALWRSTAISRTVIILSALSGVLIAVPGPLHAVRLGGGVLGLVAGACLAYAVRRDLARRSVSVDIVH